MALPSDNGWARLREVAALPGLPYATFDDEVKLHSFGQPHGWVAVAFCGSGPVGNVRETQPDIMFASDMILDMLEHERKSAGHLSSVEPSVRRIYDQVNALMKQLTD